MVESTSFSDDAVTSLAALIQHVAVATHAPLSDQDLANKQVSSYIRSLSNFGLTELHQQPNQLRSKSEALHQQLSELCISQTDAFIHIHHAEQQFAPSLTGLSTHLERLIADTLPRLRDAADTFLAASRPALEERDVVHNMADQYERGNLSDLLEIPPLVYTCVKAGHHAEAIQLTDHLIGSLKRFQQPASDPISHYERGQRYTYLSLLIETLSHLAIIKSDLISNLSKIGLKLPAARKAVSTLRRLNFLQSQLPQIPDWTSVLASQHARSLLPELGLTESQLCLAFLKARTRSLHTALESMGSPSSFSSEAYLRRYVDLWRDEMTDTLAMAFPLFVDDPSQAPSTGADARQDTVVPGYLISSFATSALQRLRDTVSTHVLAASQRAQSSPEPFAALETLAEMYRNFHTQLSYASAALSRFGFDFGKLLLAPSPAANGASLCTLESAWLDALTRSLDSAFSQLHEQLDQCSRSASTGRVPSSYLLSAKLSSGSLKDLYSISKNDTDESTAYGDYSRPNIELVDYPPFAKLLNHILSWINALQLFAPSSLASPLLQHLDSHFARVTERVVEEFPQITSKMQVVEAPTDDEAVSLLQNLEADAKVAMQTDLVRDRETVILCKVLKMHQASVVQWTIQVVRSQVFDLPETAEAAQVAQAEAVWSKAQKWIDHSIGRITQANRQRKEESEERSKAVEVAAAKQAKEKAEARQKAEEQARLKAEAEEQARRKAEEEAKAKAEAEAEAKAKAKAQEEARIKAEAEAKAKAEAEARLKAEVEAKARAEEEASIKAEAEARAKAEEEAKAKAEEEARRAAEEEQARAKAEAEEKAAEEEKAKAEAEATAAAEAKAKADQEAKEKAEAEIEKVKAEEEEERARAQAKAEEVAVKKKAEEEAEAARLQSAKEAKEKAEAANAVEKQAEEAAKANAEASAEEQAKARDQPPTTTAASPKKFSLAEKLRQRKEERDRAAAAATAATAITDTPDEKHEAKETATTADEFQETSADKDKATMERSAWVAQQDLDGAKKEVQTEIGEETSKTETVGAEGAAGDGQRGDEEAEADEDPDGDGDGDVGSGANTPGTPTTPNLGSGNVAVKKKKNKKKKKK